SMPPKNQTSVLMTLPPKFYSGHRDADQSLYWRSRRNSPLDLHRGQPAGARVPPQVLMTQGAKGRSRQADPSGQSTNQTRSGHVKGTGGCPSPGGEPLLRLLGRPWEITAFLRLAIGAATALAQLHQRGLIHKDIKPANVLVNSVTGQVWLMGFGIAHADRILRADRQPVGARVCLSDALVGSAHPTPHRSKYRSKAKSPRQSFKVEAGPTIVPEVTPFGRRMINEANCRPVPAAERPLCVDWTGGRPSSEFAQNTRGRSSQLSPRPSLDE